ncbi:HipA family kinase [Nocardioides sp.]|uniref:HipA family kinase n=1 Tax=Nocardioides sp. TaxID=35761 RepID=UPI003564C158
MIPVVRVTRYVTPLREGGSLPGIVEADDLGTYVCKFRGAGQGLRVLVAEVVVGELARRIGLPTPRLVGLDLDPAIARYEADEEVQDLLNASAGLNLGVDFLPGSFGFDGDLPSGDGVAAKVLWLDAFCANVDRSWRNPNLLFWHGDLWVIDHGASLYFHHAWSGGVTDPARFAAQAWSPDDHVLLEHAAGLGRADEEIRALLGPEVFAEVLELVPDEWLEPVPGAETPGAVRAAYVAFLTARLGTRQWLPEVVRG